MSIGKTVSATLRRNRERKRRPNPDLSLENSELARFELVTYSLQHKCPEAKKTREGNFIG